MFVWFVVYIDFLDIKLFLVDSDLIGLNWWYPVIVFIYWFVWRKSCLHFTLKVSRLCSNHDFLILPLSWVPHLRFVLEAIIKSMISKLSQSWIRNIG